MAFSRLYYVLVLPPTPCSELRAPWSSVQLEITGVLALAQDAVSSRTSNLTTKGSEPGGERAAYHTKAEGREKGQAMARMKVSEQEARTPTRNEAMAGNWRRR